MADFDEISDEERLQIAQHYLLSSPPCQFEEVLTDVRKILPDGVLTDAGIAGIARVYNGRGRVVTSPNGEKVVVCSASEVDPTHYVDPKTGHVFGIDHRSLATTEDEVPYDRDSSLDLHQAALQSAVNNYIKAKFPSENSAGGVFIKDGRLVVVLVGEKQNLRNFWSGKWTSTWAVKLSGTSAEISGDVKIHAHYFEDGNVQLQSSKPLSAVNVSFSSEAELASSFIDIVKRAEAAQQAGMEEMYSNMSEETFRSMRRSMPITRTKMDWNVNAVRMVRQVRK